MQSRYLVCYDIAEPSRWAKVFRLLKAQGEHVQYSVFVCSLTWPALTALKAQLLEAIDPRADDVRLYPLPADAVLEGLGEKRLQPAGVTVLVQGQPLANCERVTDT